MRVAARSLLTKPTRGLNSSALHMALTWPWASGWAGSSLERGGALTARVAPALPTSGSWRPWHSSLHQRAFVLLVIMRVYWGSPEKQELEEEMQMRSRHGEWILFRNQGLQMRTLTNLKFRELACRRQSQRRACDSSSPQAAQRDRVPFSWPISVLPQDLPTDCKRLSPIWRATLWLSLAWLQCFF